MRHIDKYDGIFVPETPNVSGHLSFSAKDARLTLLSNTADLHREGPHDIFGKLTSGISASLLECVNIEATQFYDENSQTRVESSHFPHKLVIGRATVSSNDRVIKRAQYQFEGLHSLVNDYKSFGSIHLSQVELKEMLERDNLRHQSAGLERNLEFEGLDAEYHPIVFYFTGKYDVIEVRTKDADIFLSNHGSYGPGTSRGVGIDNEVVLRIEFKEAKTVDELFDFIFTVQCLFQICLARKEGLNKVRFWTAEQDDREPAYQAVCVGYNKEAEEEKKSPHPIDVIVDAAVRPVEFKSVLSGWLETSSTMGEARNRFQNGFNSGVYSIDRLIGAANIFDLLPADKSGRNVEVDSDLRVIVDEMKGRIKALPDSHARQSLLSNLSRVGKSSLKDKVMQRAKVLNRGGRSFSEIGRVCAEAVNLRNHFVHGSPTNVDYRAHRELFSFLIDTLEFVFGASDLIEIGWDMKSYIERGSTLSHPFSYYIKSYEQKLEQFKRAVEG